MMNATKLSLMIFFSSTVYAHAQCDIKALSKDFAFCWTQAEGSQGTSCKNIGIDVSCDAGRPKHQWYVDAMTNAYKTGNARDLVGIYYSCQNHHLFDDPKTLPVTACLGHNEEILRAVRRVITCTRPIPGGGEISDGETGDWGEAAVIGHPKCEPL